jgi:hypothetical protein
MIFFKLRSSYTGDVQNKPGKRSTKTHEAITKLVRVFWEDLVCLSGYLSSALKKVDSNWFLTGYAAILSLTSEPQLHRKSDDLFCVISYAFRVVSWEVFC